MSLVDRLEKLYSDYIRHMVTSSKRIRIRALKGRKTYFEDLIELQLDHNKLKSKLEYNKSETDSIISKLKSKNDEMSAELVVRKRENDELNKHLNEISKLVDSDLSRVNTELNLKIEKLLEQNKILREYPNKLVKRIDTLIAELSELNRTNQDQCDKINELKAELKELETLNKSKDVRIDKIKCERDDLKLKLSTMSIVNDDTIIDRFQDFILDISKNNVLDSIIDTKNKREALLQLIKKYFK